jgi:hypothetical protein
MKTRYVYMPYEKRVGEEWRRGYDTLGVVTVYMQYIEITV